ncbi:MAG: hypothetical protein D6741_07000, partial [Planctomycetota bacterium]
LELIVKYVGPVHVITPIVEEICEIDDGAELLELGLLVMEPELDDAYAAASLSGPISFQDWLCLLTAKRHGFKCVTNDKSLRKLCRREGVPLLWGLEVLAELHKAGGIPGNDAESIAEAIRDSNPKHITSEIISKFKAIIRWQEKQRSGD